MKYLILWMLVAVPAFAGPSVSGGGDPEAIQFVEIMKELPELVRSMDILRDKVSAEKFSQLATRFEDSLNDANPANDLIAFVDEPVLVAGTPKAAKFEGGKAFVHRSAWLAYQAAGLKYRQQAIVLLEGLVALGVSLDRYAAVTTVMAIELQDIELYAKLAQLSASHLAFKRDCDWFGDTGGKELYAHTSSFEFLWKLGEKGYGLQYLVNADSFEGSLPLASLQALSFKTGSDSRDRIVTSDRTHLVLIHGGRKLLRDKDETLIRRLSDHETEYWSVKDGAPLEFLGKSNTQSVKIYRENALVQNSERLDGATKLTNVCTEKNVSTEWKDLLVQSELKASLNAFDDYARRVTNAQIAHEACVSRGGECDKLTKIRNQLLAGTDLRWKSFLDGFQAVNKKHVPRPRAGQAASSRLRYTREGWVEIIQETLEAMRKSERRSGRDRFLREIEELREERKDWGYGKGAARR